MLRCHRDLAHALNNRTMLEQAKGIVAEELNLDMQQSLVILQCYACDQNFELSDVAQCVIDGILTPSDINRNSG